MDNAFEILMNGVVRTTLCTALAASVALLLLPTLGITSPHTHRIAWVLVLLQGWLLLPLTLTVSRPPMAGSTRIAQTSLNSPEQINTLQTSQVSSQTTDFQSWRHFGRQVATATWLMGTMVVLGFYLRRYFLLIRRIPLGTAPELDEWKEEWREASNAVSATANVHFRVTQHVGPLLCFVPFVYLILVPGQLWSRLRRNERIAILRHELAHLNQGDLWKNLAIRILALPQWFNPLVWLAVRRFEEAGEWACDEAAVAASGLNRTGYADALVRIAGYSTDSPCGAVSASGGILTRRVKRILSSSNKEVSRMKNLFLPLLLLVIAAGQVIRIESVQAKEPDSSASVVTRAEALARWRAKPYALGPPDVVMVELNWNEFDAVINHEGESPSLGNVPVDMNFRGVKSFQKVEGGTKVKARLASLKGRYLIGPDGEIVIRGFAKVFVAGMTTEEAAKAIAERIPKRFGLPDVTVEVAEYNSKVVYVFEELESGDSVVRIPHKGHFTVLDALACIEMKVDAIDHAHVLSPYGPNYSDDRLDIDLKAIRSKGNDSANIELLPGDRIFFLSKKRTKEKARQKTSAPPATEIQARYQRVLAEPSK